MDADQRLFVVRVVEQPVQRRVEQPTPRARLLTGLPDGSGIDLFWPRHDQAVTSVDMRCGSSHRKSGTRFGDRACARCFFHPPVGTCALPRAIGDPRLRAAGVPASSPVPEKTMQGATRRCPASRSIPECGRANGGDRLQRHRRGLSRGCLCASAAMEFTPSTDRRASAWMRDASALRLRSPTPDQAFVAAVWGSRSHSRASSSLVVMRAP